MFLMTRLMVSERAFLPLFVLVLLASTPATRAEQPQYGGALIVASGAEPTSLLPATTTDLETHYVAGQVFNALVTHDMQLSVVPDLAESWEISGDGLTYTFRLVKNATWHDGVPFTSADVKFSIEEILKKYGSVGKTTFKDLETVETPDAYTAIIKLRKMYPPLLTNLNLFGSGIAPKHLYEGTEIVKNPHNLKPIGTGPFKFVEWVKGSHIRLEKNPKYFKKGKPFLDGVIFKYIPDGATRIIALEKGDVNYIAGKWVELSDVERLAKNPDIEICYDNPPGQGPPIGFVAINVREPPLSNVKVRKALAHSVDRQMWVEKAAFGIGKVVSYGCFPSGLAKWKNPKVTEYDYDPKKANALLDEAGYAKKADGFRFSVRLAYEPARREFVRIAEIMKEEFKEIGVNLNLLGMDTATLYDTVCMRWDFDLALQTKALGPEPAVGAYIIFHTKGIQRATFSNNMGYSNPRVDSLFDKTLETVDEQERRQYFYEIQQIISDEVPIIPFREMVQPIAYRKGLVGIPAGPNHSLRERQENVWWRTTTATVTTTTATTTPEVPLLTTYASPIIVVVLVVAAVALYAKRRK